MERRFAAYIDVERTEVTPRQIMEAINFGLFHLFKYDPNQPKFDVQVHMIPLPEQWRAGHQNTLTAVEQQKRASDDQS